MGYRDIIILYFVPVLYSSVIIEMSIKQSKNLNHSYINTEHIFLALLNDTDGICAKVLQNLGANIPRIKAYVLNELDQNHE